MPNGIELILADHRRVDALFTAFAETRDGNLVGQLIDVLSAHDDAEHAALYPLAAAVLGEGTLIGRCEQAHSAVKKQIDRLKTQEGPPLVQAVETLRKLVQRHVADEEKNLLPALGDRATPQQLDGLGARILQAKQRGG
jgi:hemerythrin superfamily protein